MLVSRTRRPSPQTVAVLLALAAQPKTWRYGYELGIDVGLKPGTLYPILMRLADRSLLESIWESAPPQGRPARHLYRLSATGLELATAQSQVPARAARSRSALRGAW